MCSEAQFGGRMLAYTGILLDSAQSRTAPTASAAYPCPRALGTVMHPRVIPFGLAREQATQPVHLTGPPIGHRPRDEPQAPLLGDLAEDPVKGDTQGRCIVEAEDPQGQAVRLHDTPRIHRP